MRVEVEIIRGEKIKWNWDISLCESIRHSRHIFSDQTKIFYDFTVKTIAKCRNEDYDSLKGRLFHLWAAPSAFLQGSSDLSIVQTCGNDDGGPRRASFWSIQHTIFVKRSNE